jgi:membrane associated rhomboid family serine protease
MSVESAHPAAGRRPGLPAPKRGLGGALSRRYRGSLFGIELLLVMVAVMWLLEVINSLDSNALDNAAGIYPRNVDHLWAIFTAPFLHAGFGHLISNTVPFLFLGLIVAWRGAARLALISLIVIVVGGLGTWLFSPGGTDTVGASGLVFGYATYLLIRGFFNRRVLEILTGALVAIVWGWVLLLSLVPQPHVSWEGHVAGAVGGVVAASVLARYDRAHRLPTELRPRHPLRART